MIDWYGVFANSLWIGGLSVLLAVWSMAYYESQRTGRRIRAVWASLGYRWASTGGLLLFCGGLAATDERLWAQLLWGLLGIAFIAEQLVWQRERQTASSTTAEHPGGSEERKT
ncbi:MAG TPA: hypothetical protein G4N98_06875 [Thermoflexia bacterium]|nr:hypothetical protein [Thermoflexia bacterium]